MFYCHLTVYSYCFKDFGTFFPPQHVCPSDGRAGRRDWPLADCNERAEVSGEHLAACMWFVIACHALSLSLCPPKTVVNYSLRFKMLWSGKKSLFLSCVPSWIAKILNILNIDHICFWAASFCHAGLPWQSCDKEWLPKMPCWIYPLAIVRSPHDLLKKRFPYYYMYGKVISLTLWTDSKLSNYIVDLKSLTLD